MPLRGTLDKLAGLHGVSFDWNDRLGEVPAGPAGRQIGVIAQEVESQFPELVTTRPDGYKAVDYGKMSAVLLEAIKEQQKQIQDLKVEVAKLRKEK